MYCRFCIASVALPDILTCLQQRRKLLCPASAILLQGFQKMCCIFRGTAGTAQLGNLIKVKIHRAWNVTSRRRSFFRTLCDHTAHLTITLYTLHSTPYRPRFTLYTPHFTCYTFHCTLHTPQSPLHTLQTTFHTLTPLYTPLSSRSALGIRPLPHSTAYNAPVRQQGKHVKITRLFESLPYKSV